MKYVNDGSEAERELTAIVSAGGTVFINPGVFSSNIVELSEDAFTQIEWPGFSVNSTVVYEDDQGPDILGKIFLTPFTLAVDVALVVLFLPVILILNMDSSDFRAIGNAAEFTGDVVDAMGGH